MNRRTCPQRLVLAPGGTVAVIGGGPAGAFFALHLLRKARELQRPLRVLVLERRRQTAGTLPQCPTGDWKGCNYCAGGISPKLSEVLRDLGLSLPAAVIQSRIRSVTIQGYWKNIELEVPPGREMLSVYRGSRPTGRADRDYSFDSFLLDTAVREGAEAIAAEVETMHYSEGGKVLVRYRQEGVQRELEAELVVVAAGVNEASCLGSSTNPILRSLQGLIPGFVPPPLRRSLIFELAYDSDLPANLAATVHFVEYGSKSLRLEMCSLVPKRGFMTVVLVGPSIDAIRQPSQNREIIRQFLELPHVRKLIPAGARLRVVCLCNPNLVVGSAQNPFADRVAAVGDLVTSRLYKDGILSAQRTAQALAETVLTRGLDAASLRAGYGPTLERFRRDHRSASVVFLLHRLFFSSSVLSRVLYQAAITERKTTAGEDRCLERILWKIASGDDHYALILRSMLRPATLWLILTGGLLVTLRNYLTELFFGLRWDGFGRFTTGVAKERLEAKRLAFSRLIAESHIAVPDKLEFERMYTIRIQAPSASILEQLELFGEADRSYLQPRWVRIRRVAGRPNEPGCVIRYEVFHRRFCFNLELEQVVGDRLAVYRVQDGFARGGALIFEIEPFAEGISTLSIYVAFRFTRGNHWFEWPFWGLFRQLFPAFVHDVLWNHSLCQLKDIAESEPRPGHPAPQPALVQRTKAVET